MTTSYDAIIIGSGAVRTEVLPQDMKATSGWITESTLVDFNELRQGFIPPNHSKESVKGIPS